MSERLTSAAYYETQQHQHLQRPHTAQHPSSMLTTGLQQASPPMPPLHYQRLHDSYALNASARLAYAERAGASVPGGGGSGIGYYGATSTPTNYAQTAYGTGYGSYLGHYYASSAYESAQYTARSRFSPYAPPPSGSQPHPHLQHQHSYPPHQHLHQHQHQHHHHPHANHQSATGIFTPAGQQLVPSSVLHYPPRSLVYPPAAQPSSYEQTLPYTRNPFAHTSFSTSASGGSYGSMSAATAVSSIPAPYQPTTQRASTPAPNRTVVPHYLEPLRSYHESLTRRAASEMDSKSPTVAGAAAIAAAVANANNCAQLPMKSLEAFCESNTELSASSPPRLTTSPPMISATGTDSGISNCSTRARSDSSQSTPIYSSEYPVNMSVESASCVSYHCEERERELAPEDEEVSNELLKVKVEGEESERESDDISSIGTSRLLKPQTACDIRVETNAKQRQPQQEPQKHPAAVDKQDDANIFGDDNIKRENNFDASVRLATAAAAQQLRTRQATPAPAAATEEQSVKRELTADDDSISGSTKREFMTAKAAAVAANKQLDSPQGATAQNCATSASSSAAAPLPVTPTIRQPAVSVNNSNWTAYPCSPTNAIGSNSQQRQSPNFATTATEPLTSTQKRQRTPPAPHNSPVSYGCAPIMTAAPTAIRCARPTPTLAPLSLSMPTPNAHSSPSGKMQITTNKNRIMECDLIPSKKSKRRDELREEIRDIKPLPAFQQAFGSTEIGRFSESFTLTAAQQQRAPSAQYADDDYYAQTAQDGGNYESPSLWSSYDNATQWTHYDHEYMMRRSSSFGMSDIMAYERYLHASNVGSSRGGNSNCNRARFGEIRCNGY